VEYVVETSQGNITAVQSDPDVSAIFAVGAWVEVGFARHRTWLLPADSQAAYSD
jgi:hypothetical protein